MKNWFYILILGLSIFKVNAQAKQEVPIDTLFSKMRHAFDLNMQNKVADAVQLTTELLEYEKTHPNDSLRANLYNVLGTSYNILDNDKESTRFFLKSKAIFETIGNKRGLNMVNNNLGISYRNQGDYFKSNQYFLRAADISKRLKEYRIALYPLYNIGVNILESGGDPEEALGYVKKAEDYSRKYDNGTLNRIKVDISTTLGQIYKKQANYNLAFRYYNLSLKKAEQEGYLDIQQLIYQDKAEIYKAQKEYDKANQMLYSFIKIKDSLIKIERFDEVKNIETKAVIKEKEEALEIVEKENKEQKAIINFFKNYNILLSLLALMLLIVGYIIYRKNKQLKYAKEKAEELSNAKSKFYSEISHELRTPLYAVIELSSILLNENKDPETREYMESLKFSGSHLMSLVNNVLEHNKIDSGMVSVVNSNFDLKLLMSNIIDSLEYGLRNSNNKIELKYDKDIPKLISGDALKLSQILINLTSNAIKFTKNGTVQIIVNKVQETEDKIDLLFAVSDNGKGISKDNQKLIFSEFYQDKNNVSKSYKGTGLGLSIVKRLVNVLGGDVSIESNLGQGTTFYFDLTFAKNKQLTAEKDTQNEGYNIIENTKVLVVDDNKINLQVTQKVLSKLNVIPTTVDNGKEAIDLIKSNKYDCVLMDLHMPDLDGYQTTRLIREFNTRVPIIALTAASDQDVKDKIEAHNINGYVLKPFQTSDFVEVLSKAIHQTT